MRRALGVCVLAAVVGAPAAADAKLFDLYVGPRLGLAQGIGEGSLRGFGMGFELGAELLLFDAIVNYTQLVGGKQSGKSLTQFLLGIDGDIPIDGLSRAQTYLRLGGAAGFGLVTPKAPDLPIDSSEISHKGLVLQGTAAIERHLGRWVIIGLEFHGGYHYFLSRNKIESALRPQTTEPPMQPTLPRLEDQWEHGMQFMGLLNARVHFEPLQN